MYYKKKNLTSKMEVNRQTKRNEVYFECLN